MPTFVIWYSCIATITNKKKGITCFFRRQPVLRKNVLLNLPMENLGPCFHKKEKLWLSIELLVLERTPDVWLMFWNTVSLSQNWPETFLLLECVELDDSFQLDRTIQSPYSPSVSPHESFLHQKDAKAIIISVILKRCFKAKKRRLISSYQTIFPMKIFLSLWLDIFVSASRFIFSLES